MSDSESKTKGNRMKTQAQHRRMRHRAIRALTTVAWLLVLAGAPAAKAADASDAPEAPPASEVFGRPIIPDLIADPSIVQFDGVFYCFATTDGYGAGLATSGLPVVWTSRDFLNWSFEGSIFADNFDAKYWAPSSLVRRDGRYYLFPTLDERITALVADSPLGPFRTLDGKDINKESGWRPFRIPLARTIDAEVFIDDDGQAYMVWAQRGIGRLTDDLSAVAGRARTVETKRSDYSEGPFLFKRKGVYYYMYTLHGHENYQYAYMLSRESPMGPWEAPEEDIIAATDYDKQIYGPGHGCFFSPEDSDQWYFAYLEYGRAHTNRQVWVDEMHFRDDGTIIPIQLTKTGVGALGPVVDEMPDLAEGKTATASSTRPDYRVPAIAYPDLDRVENFAPVNALDGSNGSRWMAAEDDEAPWFQIDLGQARDIQRTEAYFVLPTAGHAYRLESSLDGETWQPYGGAAERALRSPHTDTRSVSARYLRLTVLEGTAGLWRFRVF